MPQFQTTRAIRSDVKRAAPIHLSFFQSIPGINTAKREGEHNVFMPERVYFTSVPRIRIMALRLEVGIAVVVGTCM